MREDVKSKWSRTIEEGKRFALMQIVMYDDTAYTVEASPGPLAAYCMAKSVERVLRERAAGSARPGRSDEVNRKIDLLSIWLLTDVLAAADVALLPLERVLAGYLPVFLTWSSSGPVRLRNLMLTLLDSAYYDCCNRSQPGRIRLGILRRWYSEKCKAIAAALKDLKVRTTHGTAFYIIPTRELVTGLAVWPFTHNDNTHRLLDHRVLAGLHLCDSMLRLLGRSEDLPLQDLRIDEHLFSEEPSAVRVYRQELPLQVAKAAMEVHVQHMVVNLIPTEHQEGALGAGAALKALGMDERVMEDLERDLTSRLMGLGELIMPLDAVHSYSESQPESRLERFREFLLQAYQDGLYYLVPFRVPGPSLSAIREAIRLDLEPSVRPRFPAELPPSEGAIEFLAFMFSCVSVYSFCPVVSYLRAIARSFVRELRSRGLIGYHAAKECSSALDRLLDAWTYMAGPVQLLIALKVWPYYATPEPVRSRLRELFAAGQTAELRDVERVLRALSRSSADGMLTEFRKGVEGDGPEGQAVISIIDTLFNDFDPLEALYLFLTLRGRQVRFLKEKGVLRDEASSGDGADGS